MDFDRLHDSWQKLGATDPRWAILSQAGREDGRWDDAPFWRSGEDSIDWLARHLGGVRSMPKLDRALDFGCGIGRLTQALARHFAKVVGVDIAESMVAGARAANRHGDRVEYVHNARPDLRVFGDNSFDFVLTLIVLQHMRPDYSAAYLREFLRVLRPGGVLFFQIPIEPLLRNVTAVRPSTVAARARSPIALAASTVVLPSNRDLAENEWQWFRVDICNIGKEPMQARGPGAVEIGTRFDRIEATAATETRWTPLPHDLAPGERVTLVVADRAPGIAGLHVLAALPCIGRQWFAHPDNVPGTCRTTVGPGVPGYQQPDSPPPRPVFMEPDGVELIEVYGTRLGDLYGNITAAGGEFVDVGLNGWAGYEWVSSHFVVRKR